MSSVAVVADDRVDVKHANDGRTEARHLAAQRDGDHQAARTHRVVVVGVGAEQRRQVVVFELRVTLRKLFELVGEVGDHVAVGVGATSLHTRVRRLWDDQADSLRLVKVHQLHFHVVERRLHRHRFTHNTNMHHPHNTIIYLHIFILIFIVIIILILIIIIIIIIVVVIVFLVFLGSSSFA